MALSGKPKNEGDASEQKWVHVVYRKEMQKLVQCYKHTFVSKVNCSKIRTNTNKHLDIKTELFAPAECFPQLLNTRPSTEVMEQF